LESRLIVDPWAIHSWSNLRNGGRLCAALGLDRQLVATTFGDLTGVDALPSPAIADRNYGQGDWFTLNWCKRCCTNCYKLRVPFQGSLPKVFRNAFSYDPGGTAAMPRDWDVHSVSFRPTINTDGNLAGDGIFGGFERSNIVEEFPGMPEFPLEVPFFSGSIEQQRVAGRHFKTGIVLHHLLPRDALLRIGHFSDGRWDWQESPTSNL
jgi:hypothetical protein